MVLLHFAASGAGGAEFHGYGWSHRQGSKDRGLEPERE
jgi:hypothetical protein